MSLPVLVYFLNDCYSDWCKKKSLNVILICLSMKANEPVFFLLLSLSLPSVPFLLQTVIFYFIGLLGCLVICYCLIFDTFVYATY